IALDGECRAEEQPANRWSDSALSQDGRGGDDQEREEAPVVDEVNPLEVEERAKDPVRRLDAEELALGNLDDVLQQMEQLEYEREHEDARCRPDGRGRAA